MFERGVVVIGDGQNVLVAETPCRASGEGLGYCSPALMLL